jgi:hypothetical protein
VEGSWNYDTCLRGGIRGFRFAGFSTEMLANAVEYYDTNLQRLAATLSPGWLRYPSGALEDAFEWTNGQTVTSWIGEFPAAEPILLNDTVKPATGKGGALFTDFAAMCANVGGAKMVVTINGFTDTASSAGAFAAFALSNHLPVAVWELCNEPYVFAGPRSSFFLNSTDYVAKMKPYRDAIKAADPKAVVAIYFSDAGSRSQTGTRGWPITATSTGMRSSITITRR